MFSYQGFFVVHCVLQYGEPVPVAGVAQCNSDISQVAASFGALDGCLLEALIKGLGSERQFFGQCMRRAGVLEGRVAFWGESIPWADHLADVASEHPVSDFAAQFNGDIILEFDCKIGNTFCRLERAIWEDTLRGAGLDASCACAAVVGDEGQVGFKFEIEQDFGNKKI